MKNLLGQTKHKKCLKFQEHPLLIGNDKVKLLPLKQEVVIEDINAQILFPDFPIPLKIPKEISAIAEFLPLRKKKIWKDKLNTSEVDFLTTKLLRISDRGSTSREKVLTPFWTQQSMEISILTTITIISAFFNH